MRKLSWIHEANEVDSNNFSIDNLPFGVFSVPSEDQETKRIGSAIGSFVIDLSILVDKGLIVFEHNNRNNNNNNNNNYFHQPSLNKFMSLPSLFWKSVRSQLTDLLLLESYDNRLRGDEDLKKVVLVPMSQVVVIVICCYNYYEKVQMHMPVEIGDYTVL